MNTHDEYTSNLRQLTIGIVAGEVSGDMLGADFMQKMNAMSPNIRWVGVGGSEMTKAGLSSVIDMKRLSVMGLSEVIRHLPDLLLARREILSAFDDARIDIFVGIDAPDFNLRLGKALKKHGIFCVQYVSPSIWAWRENRIHTIKSATDLVLCLFPFELGVYAKHAHPAVCVGHPLLQKITPPYDDSTLTLSLKPYLDNKVLHHKPLLCAMAGSRTSELKAILPTLLSALAMLDTMGGQWQDFVAVLPVVSHEHQTLAYSLIDTHAPQLKERLHPIYDDGRFSLPYGLSLSQTVMALGQATLLASGTATLEAMLINSPMLVTYKVSPITYAIAKRLVKIPYVALPNILSYDQTGKPIVTELIQENASPKSIAKHLAALDTTSQKNALATLSQSVRQLSEQNPAAAVLHAFYQH